MRRQLEGARQLGAAVALAAFASVQAAGAGHTFSQCKSPSRCAYQMPVRGYSERCWRRPARAKAAGASAPSPEIKQNETSVQRDTLNAQADPAVPSRARQKAAARHPSSARACSLMTMLTRSWAAGGGRSAHLGGEHYDQEQNSTIHHDSWAGQAGGGRRGAARRQAGACFAHGHGTLATMGYENTHH